MSISSGTICNTSTQQNCAQRRREAAVPPCNMDACPKEYWAEKPDARGVFPARRSDNGHQGLTAPKASAVPATTRAGYFDADMLSVGVKVYVKIRLCL